MTNDHIDQSVLCIAVLRDHFIRNDRFTPLEQLFFRLAEKRLADIQTGRVNEAHGLALSGPSGAGKSAAIAHLLKSERGRLDTAGHGDATIISLRVPSPATLKFVGQTLLRALGYQISSERQAWYIWDLVRHHLRERRVLFVHLDEAQDLASRGTKHELNSVASMLKTLMTDDEWPVGIILSGTEELEDILNHDPQLARRMKTVHFRELACSICGLGTVDMLLGDEQDPVREPFRHGRCDVFQLGNEVEVERPRHRLDRHRDALPAGQRDQEVEDVVRGTAIGAGKGDGRRLFLNVVNIVTHQHEA